ncbi:2-oxoglutarate-dependent dioxygenase 19 isoform X1 [Vitis vinifera]|uniref:2-oxoglutarate-dependent dioxygenase 19 isoform X1 n=1 Tax=Vitis vinifera TaxID=29760 RepID=UPI00015CBD40|nr:2-oxoglutarate-dependent dioxygenase 19 isoform X1 [Vitis vinifera]|eukprot:XP_002265816.1 PREDICTED: protein DMR6-LIKE OXYGENASE 2 [Vitis vinifera]
MATATPNLLQPPNFTCVKSLSESSALTSIPSTYTFTTDPNQLLAFEPQHSIPIIDFSLLTSGDPDQRSRAIQDLDQACLEWGFFMLINHGVPESLMTGMIEACRGFFDLTEEEKREFQGTHVLSPIRCGTSFNARVDQILFWRDFLKVFVHPQFHSPSKPAGFSEVCLEYTQRMRKVAGELLKGISKSLGLEEWYIDKTMNMDSGLQILTVNLYPPCPQPEYAMGMPPHSDHSFLTILIQNGIGGLQVQHKGQWFDVNPIPNSILVNTGDHLEVLSNGKYKSVLHRAVVNNKTTRISLALSNGPLLDTVVEPVPELSHPLKYVGMAYKEYLELQQGNKLDGKTCLDRVRIRTM